MACGPGSLRPALGWIVLAAVAAPGCRWLPARAPDLGPAPMRGPSTSLPPLPVIRPVGDDEAFRRLAPTPILDAAAARDREVQRALAESTTPDPIAVAENHPVAEPDPLVEPASFAPPAAPSEIPDPPAVAPEVETQEAVLPEGPLWDYVLSALAEAADEEEAPAIIDPPAAPLDLPPVAPEPAPVFAVADLRVCRRVVGFGRTEPLAADSIAPGRVVLLYCELENVRDEATADGFRSRLACSAAILRLGQDEPVWSGDLGTGEDVCPRRRRDFFVSYPVTIPVDLPAGRYELRLTQKDLLAGSEASRSVPIEVRSR